MSFQNNTVKIEITIAGERILLSVPADRQEEARHAERTVNDLYASWRKRFPKKSHSELMAMIAFQFASFFEQQTRTVDRCREKTEEINGKLASLTSKAEEIARAFIS